MSISPVSEDEVDGVGLEEREDMVLRWLCWRKSSREEQRRRSEELYEKWKVRKYFDRSS